MITITTLLFLFVVLSLVCGIIGIILRLTGTIISGVLKLLFSPSLLVIAIILFAFIYIF